MVSTFDGEVRLCKRLGANRALVVDIYFVYEVNSDWFVSKNVERERERENS